MEARFLHADHPKNKNYLQELGGRDIPRYGVPIGRGVWLDYSAELYMKPDIRFFTGERIILREIPSSTLMATLTSEKMLVNKSCYIIRIEAGHLAYCYLLGVLNSRAIGFWVANEGDKANQNLFPRITMAAIKRLPIPAAIFATSGTYRTNGTSGAVANGSAGKGDGSIARQKNGAVASVVADVPGSGAEPNAAAQIAALVDRILEAKKADPAADTVKLEADIDALVYKLYGLTDDEIAVVEGKDKSSQMTLSADAQAPVVPPRKRGRVAVAEEHAADDDEVLE